MLVNLSAADVSAMFGDGRYAYALPVLDSPSGNIPAVSYDFDYSTTQIMVEFRFESGVKCRGIIECGQPLGEQFRNFLKNAVYHNMEYVSSMNMYMSIVECFGRKDKKDKRVMEIE